MVSNAPALLPAEDIRIPPGTAGFSLKNTFSALHYPNYRYWFLGQLASLVGSFMQVTAQGFLVFEMTHSPAYLGYVAFAAGIPSWFLMLYAGVVADRVPRRKLLMLTQAYLMILAGILTVLTLTGLVEPWHIVVLAFMVGIGQAFDAPSRHSFVFELVPREHLTNAIAMNSTMFNLATTLGPGIGGILYMMIGPGGCFAINTLSFLAVIAALKVMVLPDRHNGRMAASTGTALLDGLRYIKNDDVIRTLIIITWVVSFFCMSYMTLLPAWAVNVLSGDASTNGWLQSARGLGALIGALMIASMGKIVCRGRLISIALLAIPCILILFSLTSDLTLSLLFLTGIGLTIIGVFNLVNSSIQALVDDSLRGRVMSVYSLVFFGSLPIGSLLTGTIAEAFGEPLAIIVTAVFALGFGLYLWIVKPEIRRLIV